MSVLNKKYNCKRCKSEIKRIVETCQTCLKDFHPACTKDHRILNSKGESVICKGNCELFNRTIIGEKRYRRSRKWNEGYEEQELTIDNNPENENTEINGTNNNNINDKKNKQNSTDQVNINSLLEKKTESILNKLDEMTINNTNTLKTTIRHYITDEFRDLQKCLGDMVKSQITQELKDVKDDITAIKMQINNCSCRKPGDITSYSAVTKKNTVDYGGRIIVKSINKQQSKDTINLLKNNIDVAQLGIGVNKMINSSNGNVIIDVDKEEDQILISNEIQNKFNDAFQVKNIPRKASKIKIIGIEKELVTMDEKVFIDTIVKQNSLSQILEKPDIKIVKRYLKNQYKGSAIIEANPLIHEAILNNEKIKIEWNSYRIFNYVNVMRCYKCWGFNHIAKNCRNNITCRKCSEQHKEEDCKNSYKRCINCVKITRETNQNDLKTDHEATDVNCACYQKILSKDDKKSTRHNL